MTKSRGLRFSEAELASFLARGTGASRAPHTIDTPKAPNTPVVKHPAATAKTGRAKAQLRGFAPQAAGAAGLENADKDVKVKKATRAQLAAQSLVQARLGGSHEKGRFIEIVLDGARLLSVNDVLGMHHFARVDYRKKWHEAIHNAVLAITCGPRHWSAFERFHLSAHRRSAKACDNDALSSHFKYAIDGLRYAGVIVNDDPAHMLSMNSTQEVGPYQVRLRIEMASEDDGEGSLSNPSIKCLSGAAARVAPSAPALAGQEQAKSLKKTSTKTSGNGSIKTSADRGRGSPDIGADSQHQASRQADRVTKAAGLPGAPREAAGEP